MKTTVEKSIAAAPRVPRTRKKRIASLRVKDFWRALSDAAVSSPHTPVLRRFHD
jgi:hypothetical protein